MNDLKWAISREIPHLRRYAVALVGDPHAANDLVQDCLERGLRKRHLWRRTGSLRSWLFRILYRTYLNNRDRDRRRGPVVNFEAIEGEITTPSTQETTAHARAVVSGLALLPDEQRAAILLVALEGMSYDEAAAALGVPIGTLRSRLWRGREALRERTAAPPAATRLRRVK
jgi:RNA polymerase sigma-70 factor, ECF subfamily